jgi:hypothetical protein
VGFEDVLFRFSYDLRVAWIQAEPFDKLGRVGAAQAYLLFRIAVCRLKPIRGN